MTLADYFLRPAHWSPAGLSQLAAALLAYLVLARPDRRRAGLATAAAALLGLAVASPLAGLRALGLHAAVMVSQLLLVLVVPLFLLPLLPPRWVPDLRSRGGTLLAWGAGAAAMWAGHFLGAARLSAELAEPICGVTAAPGGWAAALPPAALSAVLLLGGLCFAVPVFHPDPARRLPPPRGVGYLFLACVSCTLLGLLVTFTASGAPPAAILPLHAPFGAPPLPSRRTDQELAGMLMWVPGCLLYVTLSARLLLGWVDTKRYHHA